jgi:predicted DNA-binding helix-hairpin-helix protein
VKTGCIKPIGFYDFMVLKPMKFSNNPFLEKSTQNGLGVAKHHISVIIQHAPLEMILRVPGIGENQHIKLYARRFQNLSMEHQEKLEFR